MGRASTVTLRKEPIILSESLFKILLLAPPGCGRKRSHADLRDASHLLCGAGLGLPPLSHLLCARPLMRTYGLESFWVAHPFCKLITEEEGAHNLFGRASQP